MYFRYVILLPRVTWTLIGSNMERTKFGQQEHMSCLDVPLEMWRGVGEADLSW